MHSQFVQAIGLSITFPQTEDIFITMQIWNFTLKIFIAHKYLCNSFFIVSLAAMDNGRVCPAGKSVEYLSTWTKWGTL